MLPSLGRRCRSVLLAGLAVVCVWTPFAVPSSASAATPSIEGPGPAMLMPRAARTAALTCEGDLAGAARPPVLLVHGTSMTPQDNWGPTYLPVLRARGHAVCTVDLPFYATRDIQANAEYVATAIRTMAARSGRRIATIGHSQGAFLPLAALRIWPDLSHYVDDVVGLAGVYDRGSERLVARCGVRCIPVLHQLASGSAYLENIGRRALPDGPSYTNIGTTGDQTVTPQPAANQQHGATSIMLQDVCPGRTLPLIEHAMIAGDAVALQLTLDALDHPGRAEAGRLDPAACQESQYPEFDQTGFLAATETNGLRMGSATTREPALYCRSRVDCADPPLRGLVTTSPRYTIGRNRVTLRARVLLTGRVKLVLGGRTITRAVRPGRLTLRVARPTKGRQLVLKARPRYYAAWAAEDTKWVRGRQR